MKKVILFLVLLQLTVSFAQRPNGGLGGNTRQASAGQERPEFESTKVAGFIEYDSKKVLKKLKLKKGDSIVKQITVHINTYNAKITSIKLENKELLEGLDIVVNQNMETAMKTRNRELMGTTMKMVQEKLKPIRDKIKAQDDELNVFFEQSLTDDQNKKWLDYQKSEREKLMPKRRRGNDARNRPDDLNGNQRKRG
ncbi:hypothetical protein [Winogradskyella sp. UBA3174]|uniref:hypothetical protein n=1 Tax=Winogradskyella sp. UBA3174 TaxID=1947785 RepID=UPI0025E3ED1B|nr:hypothetical protein [Winogradskyella sp. UBA3174]|tara:strand:- start:13690 stop:14277 length:588 start_codon:yes stop_codon:yes gene_type:complete